jgi:tetratricopeptide (TPR) repeat protein
MTYFEQKGFSFFLIVFLIFAVFSCSESDLKRQFAMEKAINDVNKLKERYNFSDGGLNEQESAELKEIFESITDMAPVPPRDSAALENSPEPLKISWQLAGLAYYNLGLLSMESEDYQAAHEYFGTLVDRYGFKQHQVRRAVFMQALALYKMDRYAEAIILYNRVAQDYALAPEPLKNPNLDVLDSPLLAAKIYRDVKSRNEFKNQISSAIDYYIDIISVYDGTPLADAAIGKLASAFLLGDLADSAVAVLEAITDPETGKVPALIRFNIGSIQQNNLRDYGAAERTYRIFIEDYPDDRLAISAQMGIGISLYYQKNYDRARYELSLLDDYPYVPSMLIAEARYLTAVCFEEEGKWDRALGEYDFVWANHAATQRGIGIPLRIAEYYLKGGKEELATQSFAEAEKDYEKLADTYAARPDIASSAMGYLIRCYVLQEKWEEAVEELKTMFIKYPKTSSGYSALPLAADILAKKLNRPSEALELLRQYLDKYPGSPVQDQISALADSLDSLSR